MTGWHITPERIDGILKDVQAEGTEAIGELTEAKFTAISQDLALCPGGAGTQLRNGLFGSVENAVGNVISGEQGRFQGIFQRIEAGVKGVAAATIEYQRADGDMTQVAAAQSAMVQSSVTGDFSFFDSYGFNTPKQ